jgi:hypothetical protein
LNGRGDCAKSEPFRKQRAIAIIREHQKFCIESKFF